jgi:hypothetical protein
MRFKNILRSPTSTNHNLTHRTSWKGRFAVLESAAEAVGRVTSECDVWPERIQQLISTWSFRSHSNNEALL